MPVGEDLDIRPASAEDLPALARDVSQLGLLQDRLRRRSAGSGELLVATLARRPVGHIYLWLKPAEERELRKNLAGVPLIMNLWVCEDCRKQGIGTALVTEAERWLRDGGHDRVALGVDPDNSDAVRLYLGLNYDPWPHTDIKTHREEFLANGDRIRIPETCAVFVKNLHDP